MSLIISGVIDGPLTGGVPKAIELYATADIADLSIYGVGSANNGGGTDGEEFTLSGSATAGDYIYVASESVEFQNYFGFAPTFTDSAANINGDDAIELFQNGAVIDVFGEIDIDGSGEPWEYLDGWAYRVDDTGPDGSTFTLSNWTFSGVNALDGESTNAGATTPFPTSSFTDGTGPVDPPAVSDFTLELLHITDQEGSTAQLSDIIGASAVLNALDAEDLGGDGIADNTIRLSAGDAIIPGVFFDASEAVFGSAGIADILIQNEMGIQAIALGNHEFDGGTEELAELISGTTTVTNDNGTPNDESDDFEETVALGVDQDGNDFTGAAFPYLSANLDFLPDTNLAPLEVAGGQAPMANVVTSSTILDVNGEQVAVVGATVPTLGSISSPGDVGVLPAWAGDTPTSAELDALALIIQTEVDALLAANTDLNKVILASHMQQISIEQGLASRLTDVDIIIAGGSNTRLFDDNDVPRAGDSDQGQYPQFLTDADGKTTALVNTDGSYKYVGRLVIDFDADGNIIPTSYDETVSGAYATDAAGVTALGAAGQEDEDIVEIVDLIDAEIIATEGNIFGISDVFLNGNRSGTFAADDPDGVRTQETNLGNLTADANLAYANQVVEDNALGDPVLISIKNGGGIRANIGEVVVPAGGTEAVRTPNAELLDGDGNVIKPEGGISQTDIQSTLAFNNDLVLVDITRQELVNLIEGGVSALPNVNGGFLQVAGLKFSFDETQQAQVLDVDGNIVTPGERIQNAGIFDENDTLVTELVRDGELVGDPDQAFRAVTLNFLVDFGDPILAQLNNLSAPNRVDLNDLDGDGNDDGATTGAATFADDGTEQDALAEYLNDNFNTAGGGTPFDKVDGGPESDERIQNLTFREDTVLPEQIAPTASGDVLFNVVAEFQGEGLDSDGNFDPDGASEVVAHEDGVLYVTNGNLDRIDVFDLNFSGTDSMLQGEPGWNTKVLHSVGETIEDTTGALNDSTAGDYTPVGIMDGIGAYELDHSTVRVFVSHELGANDGYAYDVSNGAGGTFTIEGGARVSYFDIDKETKHIVDSGLAFNTIYDQTGSIATDNSFTFEGGESFNRFCSSVLIEAHQFGSGRGLEDRIFFAGEETGGVFSNIGGNEWALDVETGDLWALPDFGRGAWENVAEVDTGTTDKVAFILMDDTAPFNITEAPDFSSSNDTQDENFIGAPMYMYVGEKNPSGNFIEQNGLSGGDLYVWVATSGASTPEDFNGNGTSEGGSWVLIDNDPVEANASEDGSTGFDEFGYPTQRNLWEQANDAGAFQFSRPEDIAVNPADGSEVVFASTGRDGFANEADTVGTIYTVDLGFDADGMPTSGTTTILYDGDADPDQQLRSPDNLDWADNGLIYVQEDRAASGLFGDGAANPNDAGILEIDPATGEVTRIANINQDVTLGAIDENVGEDGTGQQDIGDWESSGILDVSTLFDETPGTLFLYDVQAHALDDQNRFASSEQPRLTDGDLKEGGQLGLLQKEKSIDLTFLDGYGGVQSVAVKNGVIAAAIARDPIEVMLLGETVLATQPGFVALFDAGTLDLLSTVDVGNLPDQLTFTPDGTEILVAGEGEYNADSIDDGIVANPLGTVAIIDVADPTAPTAEILNFTKFNGLEDVARDQGIRIQDGVAFDEDVEPEYIAVSPDGTTAFISLQESNAIAKLDLATNEIVDVFSLGTQDFSTTGIDPLDDGNINIDTFQGLTGFRMADSIASFEVRGTTYVATANEGDSRDFDEDRVFDLATDGRLDPTFQQQLIDQGDLDLSNEDFGLGRLEVSSIDGDTDGDGDIDELFTFSSRSFSIFDQDGNLVFDSGDDFEKILADIAPERFNDDDGDDGEDRSDAKGPEPEAITVGEVGGRLYAFIGLERDSGIMIYDIVDPANAFFVNYIPPVHVDNAEEGEIAKHAPEVIAFISEDESTTGNAQIAVAYEVSGSTIVYDLESIDPIVTIMDIQGAGHVSSLEGEEVKTSGVVTAVDFNGYYLQEPDGDGDDATSDAIFVFTGNGNAIGTVEVGDEILLTGTVAEFIPGGAGTGNLSTTQLSNTTILETLSTGNDIAPLVLGAAGRTPPTEVVISDDELPVNLQTEPGDFDPEEDGIDFYESLEGMLVTVDNPVAVSATNRFDETWVLADEGDGSTPGLNDRSGININADADGYGDLNPERIQIQYDSFFDLVDEASVPGAINTGDLLGDVTGVVGYSFGNFEVLVTEEFEVLTPTANEQEVTGISKTAADLTVATYNVLNVTADVDQSGGADDDADQIAQIASQIVNNLGSPDIIALQEIQDDSGVTDDGTVTADATMQAIVDAIAAAGGGNYAFDYAFRGATVDVDGENGGVPGGNIRNAFLYDTSRVSAQGFNTLESNVLDADFDVSNPNAFDGSRDPFMGVFEFNGQEVKLINNHFSSRFGSEPVFGGPQPFNQGGEAEREEQAKAINDVVDSLLEDDADANVIVLGDLNTFEFTDELAEDLPGVGDEKVLTNLIEIAEGDEAYTFNFQGNSQALDHIFVTDGLLDGADVDYVHVNVDFTDAASDHEPILASFSLPADNQFGTVQEVLGLTDTPESITYLGDTTYERPVVFATPPTNVGLHTASVSFEEVTSSSVTAYIEEADFYDGTHGPEDFALLAFEEGSYQLDDGSLVEAGTVNVAAGDLDVPQSVAFSTAFTEAPTLLLQLQTSNSLDWAVARADSVSSTGFEYIIEEQEDSDGVHDAEVLGYVAVEATGVWGTLDWGGMASQALDFTNKVNNNNFEFKLSEDLGVDPLVAAAITSNRGADTATLRLTDITDDGSQATVRVRVQEELSLDREMAHNRESISVLAFEGEGGLFGDSIFFDI